MTQITRSSARRVKKAQRCHRDIRPAWRSEWGNLLRDPVDRWPDGLLPALLCNRNSQGDRTVCRDCRGCKWGRLWAETRLPVQLLPAGSAWQAFQKSITARKKAMTPKNRAKSMDSASRVREAAALYTSGGSVADVLRIGPWTNMHSLRCLCSRLGITLKRSGEKRGRPAREGARERHQNTNLKG